MKTRREFLQAAATGAVVLGAQSQPGLAKAIETATAAAKSKVVVAKDPTLNGNLDEKKVLALLDKAIAAYTGIQDPIKAWKKLVPVDKRIGIKTNGLGGKGICSHAVVAYAIAERLQQAGVKPGQIIIWDRNNRDLEICGLKISTEPGKVRCFGTDVSGFEEQPVKFGIVDVRLSKILTRECDYVIGLPILKDHRICGVTLALKNAYGMIDKPFTLHENGCNPGVPDLNCIPEIRAKLRLTIGDALTSVYDGGPGFRPERLWYPNALIVGEDHVAMDHVAWEMIEKRRTEAGLPTLEGAGRKPLYIATAAEPARKLGTNDPARIHLVQV